VELIGSPNGRQVSQKTMRDDCAGHRICWKEWGNIELFCRRKQKKGRQPAALSTGIVDAD
jgi:hypothetical protein